MDTLKILLLEDSQTDVQLLRRFLKNDGWTTEMQVVDNRKDWTESLDNSWDVCLSDHSIPGFSAIEALNMVQKKTPDLPFILISGQIGEERAVDLLKAGATDFVSKNNISRLGPVLRRIMEEKKLKYRQEEILGQKERAEKQFRNYFQHSLAALMMFRQDGQIIDSNPTFRTIFQLKQGVDPNFWSLFSSEETMRELRNQLELYPHFGPRVYKFQRTDGGSVYLLCTFHWLESQTHRLLGANFLDYTKLHLMEEKMLRASKMESLGVFAGGMAHDFNNLLTIVSGQTSMIEMENPDLPQLQTRLAEIQKASQRGADLVRHLLLFVSQKPTRQEPLSIVALLSETVAMIREVFPENIQVKEIYSPDLPLISGDKGQLGQVFVNLLLNAKDAMPGGGTITIRTWWEQKADKSDSPGSSIVVELADSGTGMPKEVQARIFDPFFTTKEPGRGTGLGLAVVSGILSAHQIQIDLVSEVGRGTIFHLTIPVPQAVENTVGRFGPKVTNSTKMFLDINILFVDNEPSILTVGEALLKSKVRRVILADNGWDALKALDEKGCEISLVISDFGMPGMDGKELAERIMLQHPGIPIIMTTGYFQDELNNTLLKAGVARVMQKPFDWDELWQAVTEVVVNLGNGS